MKSFYSTVMFLWIAIMFVFSGCQNLQKNEKTVTIPLKTGLALDNGATPWYAEFCIGKGTTEKYGNKKQLLKLIMDTGTESTWVTSGECNTVPCNHHRKYNSKLSSTYMSVSNTIRESCLGPWGEFSFITGKDFWGFFAYYGKARNLLNSVEVNDMVFLEAVELKDGINDDGTKNTNWDDLVQDGSLAIPSVFNQGTSTQLLALLIQQGKVEKKIVSFYTYPQFNFGEVIFGGTNNTAFVQSTLEYFPVVRRQNDPDSQDFLWTVSLSGIEIGGKRLHLPESILLAFDSGSSRFKGDSEIITAIMDGINKFRHEAINNSETSQKNEYPDIKIYLVNERNEHIPYTLTPDHYFQEFPEGSKPAFHPLVSTDKSSVKNLLLVGSVFMDHFYTIFDYSTDPVRVGIANLQLELNSSHK